MNTYQYQPPNPCLLCAYDHARYLLLLQFNCLVTSGEVSASPRFLNLSDSCELGNMSRLTHYCLEASLRNSFRLHNIVNDRIYTPLSNYYSGIVVNVNVSQWIVASSIPPHQEDSIVSTLTQTYSCINEFI